MGQICRILFFLSDQTLISLHLICCCTSLTYHYSMLHCEKLGYSELWKRTCSALQYLPLLTTCQCLPRSGLQQLCQATDPQIWVGHSCLQLSYFHIMNWYHPIAIKSIPPRRAFERCYLEGMAYLQPYNICYPSCRYISLMQWVLVYRIEANGII